jgi:nitroreductase
MTVDKAEFLAILHRRHACHDFVEKREIPSADLEFILESGRLSPSSFGMEPWKFLVASSKPIKTALRKACFDQAQVESACTVVVVLARLKDSRPGSDYVNRHLARENAPENLPQAQTGYANFAAQTDLRAWAIAQCHIAAANMMTAAAVIGVDSCAIGGFDENAITRALGLDPDQFAVALVLPLGYCVEAPQPKQRLPLSEIVDYRA